MKTCLVALAIFTSWLCMAQVDTNAKYNIVNGAHSSYLSVNGNTQGSGVIHSSAASPQAVWEFVNIGGGFYRIRNISNGLYIANFGAKNANAPLKLTSTPGDGAAWSINGNSSTKFWIKNKLSGLNLSSGGNRSQNAQMVQAGESQYSYWDLNNLNPSTNASAGTQAVLSQPEVGWVEAVLPNIYFGRWKIYSRNASKNDVTISNSNVLMGAMNTQIYRTYVRDGVYKVITTYNNYYQCHFLKERQGGIGGGGIYIIDIDGGYRSFDQANNVPLEGQQFDQGFR